MRIAFLSFKTLLDRNSGASLEIKTVLEHFAKAGCPVQSFTMNCYDIGDAYTADEAIDQRLNPQQGCGQLFHYDHELLRHYLLVGRSKDTMKIDHADLERFLSRGMAFLSEFNPSVIVYYGSNELIPLLQHGKHLGAKLVFYVGNAAYDISRADLFSIADSVIVPSGYLKKLYDDRFGCGAVRIQTILPFDVPNLDLGRRKALRTTGTVTMINPSPDKGGHVFLRLARLLEQVPNRFLIVESRTDRAFWKEAGFNPDQFSNVHWAPYQKNIGSILENSAVLVVPSLVSEGAGKVIVEAGAFGVPVVAFNSGGIADQLADGGILVQPDRRVLLDETSQKYDLTFPDEALSDLEKATRTLLSDETQYMNLARKGHKNAMKYSVSQVIPRWREQMV